MVAFHKRGPVILYFLAGPDMTPDDISAIESFEGANVKYRNGAADVAGEHLEVADAVAGPGVPTRYSEAYKVVTTTAAAEKERDKHQAEVADAISKGFIPIGAGPMALSDAKQEAAATIAKDTAKATAEHREMTDDARAEANAARAKAAAEWAKNKPASTAPAADTGGHQPNANPKTAAKTK